MKKYRALNIILIEWALAYFVNGSEKCIYELIQERGNIGESLCDISLAVDVWFGYSYLTDKKIEEFAAENVDLMLAIHESITDIMLGEIPIGEVMLHARIKTLKS